MWDGGAPGVVANNAETFQLQNLAVPLNYVPINSVSC
jgi:hypothetical protein